MPAAVPPQDTVSVVLASRGGGPERTVNFPNFASSTDRVTVQLNDFEGFSQNGDDEEDDDDDDD
jgi:hypothetical protein